MPYFLVSWSLCIEEHFYLVMPVFAAVAIAVFGTRYVGPVLIVALMASTGLRLLEWTPGVAPGFGYAETATHLRLDGLVLGFAMSYLGVYAPAIMTWLARNAGWLLAAGVAACLAIAQATPMARYVLWPLAVAWSASALITPAALWDQPIENTGWFSWLAGSIALTSYSMYLVHAVAIHLARAAALALPQDYWLAYWPIVLAMIGGATAAFYLIIEKPSIRVRDAVCPRRERAKVLA